MLRNGRPIAGRYRLRIIFYVVKRLLSSLKDTNWSCMEHRMSARNMEGDIRVHF